jgi:hypothetical protein
MGDEPLQIERTDCANCGGTGEITKAVAGRSGQVPCPDCDNVPEHALPDNPPENPRERLQEIEERREELNQEEAEIKQTRKDLREIADDIKDVANRDVVDEETATILNHFRRQLGEVTRETLDDRYIHHESDHLNREEQQLKTLLEYIDGDSEEADE